MLVSVINVNHSVTKVKFHFKILHRREKYRENAYEACRALNRPKYDEFLQSLSFSTSSRAV